MRLAADGAAIAAAGLTPKGRLLFFGRLVGLSDRLRLLLPGTLRESVRAHLAKYAVFQKVAIVDRSDELARIGLIGVPEGWNGPTDPTGSAGAAGSLRLSGEGEFSAEILAPAGSLQETLRSLESNGASPASEPLAEALRIEAGRPRFGQDADGSHLADEVGLAAAVSTTKGCYVGQEIVARLRTYGRVNRRLVGFRFPEGTVEAGSLLLRPGETDPGRIEPGRVTSAAESPRFGPIGLGWAFRDVSEGDRLVAADGSDRGAIVASLPFA